MKRVIVIATVQLLAAMLSQATASGCLSGELQLVANNAVNICIEGVWRTFCHNTGDNVWGTFAPAIGCQQLGFLEKDASASFTCQSRLDYYAQITRCNTLENSLDECMPTITNNDGCKRCTSVDNGRQILQLFCQPDDCSKSEIRLVNGISYREGRVEVCVDGRWGTVCGEGWTNEDAGHVCAHLGYPKEGAKRTLGYFSPGTSLIRNCTDKTNISTCTPVTNCSHTMDLGVVCKSHDQVTEILINRTLKHCSTIDNQCDQSCPNENMSGQCDNTLSSVLGVLVGILTVLLVTLLVTCSVIIKKIKLQQEQEKQYTVERIDINPSYGTNISPPMHSHNEHTSNGPTYETIGNSSQTSSTVLTTQSTNTITSCNQMATIKDVDYEGVYSVVNEEAGCEGV